MPFEDLGLVLVSLGFLSQTVHAW